MKPYEKAQLTLIRDRFDGDIDAYNEWKRNRASKGGIKSGNRPFKNKKLAKQAGDKGRAKRYGRQASV